MTLLSEDLKALQDIRERYDKFPPSDIAVLLNISQRLITDKKLALKQVVVQMAQCDQLEERAQDWEFRANDALDALDAARKERDELRERVAALEAERDRLLLGYEPLKSAADEFVASDWTEMDRDELKSLVMVLAVGIRYAFEFGEVDAESPTPERLRLTDSDPAPWDDTDDATHTASGSPLSAQEPRAEVPPQACAGCGRTAENYIDESQFQLRKWRTDWLCETCYVEERDQAERDRNDGIVTIWFDESEE